LQGAAAQAGRAALLFGLFAFLFFAQGKMEFLVQGFLAQGVQLPAEFSWFLFSLFWWILTAVAQEVLREFHRQG